VDGRELRFTVADRDRRYVGGTERTGWEASARRWTVFHSPWAGTRPPMAATQSIVAIRFSGGSSLAARRMPQGPVATIGPGSDQCSAAPPETGKDQA
jgi:hypothetical protein